MAKILGTNAADILTGTKAGDVIRGGAGDDAISGLDGADELYGDDGNDIIDGGSGDDRIQGGNGGDTLHGASGNDWIEAGPGDDYVYGDAGDDFLTGSTGDDYVYGGDGGDKVDGFFGTDLLWGGAGADIFRFPELAYSTEGTTLADGTFVSGVDTIMDFESGWDKIDLSGIDADATTAIHTVRQKGSITTIGDDAFSYVAIASGATQGELTSTYDPDAGITTIYGYTDNLAGADLVIRVAGQINPEVDFIL